MNLLYYLKLNNSEKFSKYLKSKSVDELNTEFKTIFSNKNSEKIFFRAIIQFDKDSQTFIDYLINSIDNLSEPLDKKIYCLGWLNSYNSIKSLRILAENRNAHVRAISLFVLGEVCEKSELQFIGSKIHDIDNNVSKTACFSLGWNQGKVRYTILLNELKKAKPDKAIFVRMGIKMFES